MHYIAQKRVSYGVNTDIDLWDKMSLSFDLNLTVTYAYVTPMNLALLMHIGDQFCAMLTEIMTKDHQHNIFNFMLSKA